MTMGEIDDPFRHLLGLELAPDRLQEVLSVYRLILMDIHKLRELDLTDIHPAVVFEPTAPYRRSSKP